MEYSYATISTLLTRLRGGMISNLFSLSARPFLMENPSSF